MNAHEPRVERLGQIQKFIFVDCICGCRGGNWPKPAEQPEPLRHRLCHGGRGESMRHELKRPS
jgi:hypothetical protein